MFKNKTNFFPVRLTEWPAWPNEFVKILGLFLIEYDSLILKMDFLSLPLKGPFFPTLPYQHVLIEQLIFLCAVIQSPTNDQSCKMSQIGQIYLCKFFEDSIRFEDKFKKMSKNVKTFKNVESVRLWQRSVLVAIHTFLG